MKKLLISFFTLTCIAPLPAMEKKTPRPLLHLAALKVRARDVQKLPTALAAKVTSIRTCNSNLKSKLTSTEKSHYMEFLSAICHGKHPELSIEEMYKVKPQLIEENCETFLGSCLWSDNRTDAEWLLKQFPFLLALDLKSALKESVQNECLNSFNLLTEKLHLQTPCDLHTELTKTILELGKKYKKPVATWLTLNRDTYSDENKFLKAIAQRDFNYIENHLNYFDKIIKEPKHHLILKALFKDVFTDAFRSNNFQTVATTLKLFKSPSLISLVQSEIRSIILETRSLSNGPFSLYEMLLEHCSSHDQIIKDHLTNLLGQVIESMQQNSELLNIWRAHFNTIILLKYGADPSQPLENSSHGRVLPVVLVIEAQNDREDIDYRREIVGALLSKNTKEQMRFYKELTGKNLLFCKNAHHFIDLLTARGCSINERNEYGQTPLFNLLRQFKNGYLINNFDIISAVEKFLFYGADPHAVTTNGSTIYSLLKPDNHLDQYNQDDPTEQQLKHLLFGTKPQSWMEWFKHDLLEKPISKLKWSKHSTRPLENATFKSNSKRTLIAPPHLNTELAAILKSSVTSGVFKRSAPHSTGASDQIRVPRLEDID